MDSAVKTIYLDNAATTAVHGEVAELVLACMTREYGNPSSAHHVGIEAERLIKRATGELATAIGDRDGDLGDILWTSGGTESDALGIIGPARAKRRLGQHVVYAAIEHPAVRESAVLLSRQGWTATAAPVDADGVLDVERTMEQITDETTVCGVMLVNNEIGTVQPVAALAKRLAAERPDVHLHCDAVQALGKIDLDVRTLGAHSVAFAAHKIHGPKGVGALWVARGARIEPLIGGGGQQRGVRPGTFNVPGIVGLGAAARLATTDLDERRARWSELGALLVEAARSVGTEVRINGGGGERAPHIVSLAFANVPAEPLLHVLESRGVMVSAGSACSERDRKPSPVLTAIGLPAEFGTIRLSLGRDTTRAEVERAAEILADAARSFI